MRGLQRNGVGLPALQGHVDTATVGGILVFTFVAHRTNLSVSIFASGRRPACE